MGSSSYSVSARSARAETMNFMSNTVAANFPQSKEGRSHQSMSPEGVRLREARDSTNHPNSVPIILGLDVTGSMGRIPQYLVQTGLPKLMSGIIQHGVEDPALLFVPIGDTNTDSYPLQVGQFESGDEELDMWLTRTYLEGGGGPNLGESYLLAWYFAANHTATDAWDKRHEKGFLFTIGDEPCLNLLPRRHIQRIMGNAAVAQADYTDKDLLAAAQEKWHVYHLHMMEGSQGVKSLGYWLQLLGDNCIEITDQHQVASVITDIVTQKKAAVTKTQQAATPPSPDTSHKDDTVIL